MKAGTVRQSGSAASPLSWSAVPNRQARPAGSGLTASAAPSPGRNADRQKARDDFSVPRLLLFPFVFPVFRFPLGRKFRPLQCFNSKSSKVLPHASSPIFRTDLFALRPWPASPSAPPNQGTVLVSVLKVSTSSRIMKQSSPTMTRAKASEASVTPAAVQTFQIP